MAGPTISGCYAPPDILDNTPRKGWTTPGSRFGNLVEHPIFTDYVIETHGSWYAAAVANLTTKIDWGDSGQKASYIDELMRHHPQLDRKAIEDDEFQFPDILTTGGPVRLAGVVLFTRNEYYEIKPNSPTGRKAGREKKADIDGFYARHGLKVGGVAFYAPGETYPGNTIKRFRLPGNSLFEYGLQSTMRRAGFTAIRLYVEVTRLEAGLLVYRICIEVDQEKERLRKGEQDAAASGLAKHLYAWWLLCHEPQVYDAFRKVEVEHSYRGEPFPRIRCRFEAIPQLQPWQERIERNMYTRGIGYPGDEFIIACDEGFYQRLVPSLPSVTVADYWRGAMAAARLMVSALAGVAAWNAAEPMILRVKDLTLERLNLMFPNAEMFVNTILAWVERNPDYTIMIVVGAVVVTAAVAAFWEAALLPAAEEAIEAGLAAAARPASALGRVVLTEAQESQIYAGEQTLLRTAGARIGLVDPAELARISLGGSAANDVVAASARLMAAPFVKQVAVGAAAAGFTMVVHTTEAYAGPAASAGGTVAKAPSATQAPISSHAERLYVAQSVPWPPPTKRPVPGQSADLSQHVLRPVQTGSPEVPAPLIARYLGHLTVT